MNFLREEKTFANTEGTFTVQTIVPLLAEHDRHGGVGRTTPTSRRASRPRSRRAGSATSTSPTPTSSANGAEVGARKPCRSSRPSRSKSGATISCSTRRTSGSRSTRSIAHPTELDRALGFEANYAGTSFVAPPEKVLGQLKYGPPLMNIQGDRSQDGSLAACGWDDEGVAAGDVRHHQERHLRRLPDDARAGAVSRLVVQEARQADALARLLVRADRGPTCSSSACRTCRCCRATKDLELGGHHRRDRSRHRDHRRRLVLDRPAALQRAVRRPGCSTRSRAARSSACSRTSPIRCARREFWGAMDMIGGKRSYCLGGAFNDGKGQPAQSERGEPRLRAGALPQRQRHQHREEGVSHSTITRPALALRPLRGALPDARRVRGDRQEGAVVREGRRDARHDHERRARQHALRREPDLDERRQLRHDRHRAQRRSASARASSTTNKLDDASLKRRRRARRSAGAARAGRSGGDAGARAADSTPSRKAGATRPRRSTPAARAAAVKRGHRAARARRASSATGYHRDAARARRGRELEGAVRVRPQTPARR